MVEVVFVGDLVEKNGKTVKENNLEIKHAIPIGALVEINLDYSDSHKTRQFIAGHIRDCDGSPIYSTTPHRNQCDDKIAFSSFGVPSAPETIAFLRRMYHNGGWSDDCLIVIEEEPNVGQS